MTGALLARDLMEVAPNEVEATSPPQRLIYFAALLLGITNTPKVIGEGP